MYPHNRFVNLWIICFICLVNALTITGTATTPTIGGPSSSHSIDVYYGPASVKLTLPTMPVYENDMWEPSKCESVDCRPKCTVTWSKGSETVESADNVVKLFSEKKVQRADTGVYTCKAINTNSSNEISDTTSITVNYPPDVTVSWNKDTNTLTCTAKGNPASYTFKPWRQLVNKTIVRNFTGEEKAGGTYTYKFNVTSYQDTGEYYCYVNNNINNINKYPDKNNSTNVLINDKPVLISSKESYNVSKGDPLDMLIDVYSKPEIQRSNVMVYHNGTHAENATVEIVRQTVDVDFYNKSVSVEGFRITASFVEMLEEDFGFYTVIITNTEGSTETKITIHPEGAPDLPTELRISDINHNSLAVHLKSGFYNGADQTFIVKYKKHGNDSNWVEGPHLYAGDKKNLDLKARIEGLDPTTFYMFRSYGSNMFGKSNFTSLVNATTPDVPFNTALLGGALGSSIVVVLMIVLIGIIIIRKKRNGKSVRETEQVKMSEIIRDNDNEYTAEPSAEVEEHYVNEVAPHSDSVIYQNTEILSTPINSRRKPALARIIKPTNYKDSIDEPAEGEMSPLDDSYIDFNDTHENTNEEKYMNVNIQQQKPDAVEEAYLDMNTLRGKALATQEDDAEVTYLDMDKDKLEDYQNVANKGNDETYTTMEMKPKSNGDSGKENSAIKDYINVSEYKKKTPAPSSKKTKGQSAAVKSSGNIKRESIPDYVAPPPPPTTDAAGGRFQTPPQEDDYMNIRLGNR